MEKTLWENLKIVLSTYRRRFVIAGLMVFVANLLMVLVPLIFRQAVLALDTQNTHMKEQISPLLTHLMGNHLTSTWSWVVLLLSLTITASLIKYRMRLAFFAISRDVEKHTRSKLFARVQEQSMAFYDRHGIGELLSRLTNDISAYRDVLGPGIMLPLFFTTLVFPGILALYSISPLLATVSIIPLLLIPLLNFVTRNRVYRLSYQAQEGLADLSTMTQEHYSGIRIVKGYAVESNLKERFSRLCFNLIGVNVKLNCFQGFLYPFFSFITKLITVLLVIFTGLILIKAWGSLSVADFVSFMWIQSYIFFPLMMLAWVLPIYERGRAAYARLVEIYDEPIEVKDRGTKGVEIPEGADIEFTDLTFCYPTSPKAALQDFSLHIKGKSFVGITGPVGAGKTTLFRILNREYEIPLGKVKIGGRELHEYPLKALWNEMVTVEQIPFLFSRTIADNVRFGKAEALLVEIEAAAEYADLHETVQGFPEQYNTIIGERGVTLSGGQKQRLAVARAFLVDRSIVLLDDIFSAVDTETEARIFKAMRSNLENKTVLLITHRASVLQAMDRVIYMKEGKIIEDGSPDELKAMKGYYAALVDLQSREL